jgi:glutaredoxin
VSGLASEQSTPMRPIEITLLVQHDCHYCDHAKQILHAVSRDFSLRVNEIDLASDEGKRLAEHAGVLFAPGVLVGGQPFSFGRLSERKLRRALKQRACQLQDGR